MNAQKNKLARTSTLLAVALSALLFAGCQRKDKVLDVKTPGGEVNVEKNVDTGQVDVKVKRD